MSLGFGHLVGAWLPGKIVEKAKKSQFSALVWGLLLFGSILPDADFVLEWSGIAENVHRTFTHSLVFIPFVGLLIYIVARYAQRGVKLEPWACSLAIMAGVFAHLFYDSLLYPGVNLLWPFDWWLAEGALYFTTQTLTERVGPLALEGKLGLFIFDMGLGAAWFFYFLARGRLKP